MDQNDKKFGIFYGDTLLESYHIYDTRSKAEIALARLLYFARQNRNFSNEYFYVEKLEKCQILEVSDE